MIRILRSYLANTPCFKNKNDILTIILIILITSYFYMPLFQNIDHAFSSVDWYEKYCLMTSSRKAILEYRQFPLRSPFIFGGYPTIGHPYDDSINPLFLLILFFGEVIGLKILIFSIFIISALGMFYLTRYVLNYNLPGSFFSTITFILSSYGGCQITEGNLEKLYLYFLPWLLAFFIKSKKEPRFIIATCLILSIFLMKGTIAISALLFMFFFACLNVIEKKERQIYINFSYILIFLIIVSISFTLCAPKILPALQLLGQKQQFIHFPFEDSYKEISHYTVISGRALSLKRLFESLLVPEAYIVEGDDFSQMYLGYIPIAFFFLSFFVSWRKTLRLLIILAIFIIIASGSNSSVDLFKLIWHLHPFVHSIWSLDDAFYIYIFFIICIVSGSFFLLMGRLQKKRILFLPLFFILIFFSIYNMFKQNQRFLYSDLVTKLPQFGQEIPRLSPQKSFFQVQLSYPEKTKDDYFYILQNVGVVNYHQNLLIKIGNYAIAKYIVDRDDYKYIANPEGKLMVNPEYKGEAFFLDEENQAKIQYFSPNQMRIMVIIKKPGQLVINQNYHKGWRTNLGGMVSHQGLLSVTLKQKGMYEVVLKYVPLDFYLGLIISLIAIACFFIIFRFSERMKTFY